MYISKKIISIFGFFLTINSIPTCVIEALENPSDAMNLYLNDPLSFDLEKEKKDLRDKWEIANDELRKEYEKTDRALNIHQLSQRILLAKEAKESYDMIQIQQAITRKAIIDQLAQLKIDYLISLEAIQRKQIEESKYNWALTPVYKSDLVLLATRKFLDISMIPKEIFSESNLSNYRRKYIIQNPIGKIQFYQDEETQEMCKRISANWLCPEIYIIEDITQNPVKADITFEGFGDTFKEAIEEEIKNNNLTTIKTLLEYFDAKRIPCIIRGDYKDPKTTKRYSFHNTNFDIDCIIDTKFVPKNRTFNYF